MSRRMKLYAKIRQNPKDVRYEELKTLLELCGYSLRQTSGGSHRWFVKPGCEPIHFPEHHPVGEVYVKKALKVLEDNGSLDDDS